jgi:hypothetical protein
VVNVHSGFKMSAFRDASASFGMPIPSNGIHGRAVEAEPTDGCSEMVLAPTDDIKGLPMIAVIGKLLFAWTLLAGYLNLFLKSNDEWRRPRFFRCLHDMGCCATLSAVYTGAFCLRCPVRDGAAA